MLQVSVFGYIIVFVLVLALPLIVLAPFLLLAYLGYCLLCRRGGGSWPTKATCRNIFRYTVAVTSIIGVVIYTAYHIPFRKVRDVESPDGKYRVSLESKASFPLTSLSDPRSDIRLSLVKIGGVSEEIASKTFVVDEQSDAYGSTLSWANGTAMITTPDGREVSIGSEKLLPSLPKPIIPNKAD